MRSKRITWQDIREVIKTEARFLLFQRVKPDMERHGAIYLALGIGSTWLAGIGRYWDHPKAALWQYLGLGSVAYLFLMSLVLWLLLMPLRPRNWTYRNVLTFVGMTAPPGLLYALPVERWVSLSTAQEINVWFLAAVALWRMTLLFLYLKRSGNLGIFQVIVAVLFPVDLIIVALTMLNLEKAVFEIMAGLRTAPPTPNDAAYAILVNLTFLSVISLPILLIAYFVAIPVGPPQSQEFPIAGEEPVPDSGAGGADSKQDSSAES
jgi:hypothetical protein